MEHQILKTADGRDLDVYTTLDVKCTGSCIIFCHGTPGNATTWEHWLKKLNSMGQFAICYSRWTIFIFAYMYMYICRMCIHKNMYIYMYIYLCVYVYSHICICKYFYTYDICTKSIEFSFDFRLILISKNDYPIPLYIPLSQPIV
jgi:hypothetical protein